MKNTTEVCTQFKFEVGDMVMIKNLKTDTDDGDSIDSIFGGLLAIVVKLAPLDRPEYALLKDRPEYTLFIPTLGEELYFFEHEFDLV